MPRVERCAPLEQIHDMKRHLALTKQTRKFKSVAFG